MRVGGLRRAHSSTSQRQLESCVGELDPRQCRKREQRVGMPVRAECRKVKRPPSRKAFGVHTSITVTIERTSAQELDSRMQCLETMPSQSGMQAGRRAGRR